MKIFSTLNRETYLKDMSLKELDLFVIGGGITGAGIALDAVSRGLTVGLVEMEDFASGTSSRSTKLVHGGLRYLKQLEVKLVAEVGKERAIVYENAPHVTTPERMLLPIIKGGSFGKISTSIGLRVYDFLANVHAIERRKMLNRKATLEREPLLKKEGLKGSGLYVEYKTDDARLTLEILKEAVERGALAVNYTKAERFIYEDDGQVEGVVVKDRLTNKTSKIRAKKIVNATGPWVDTLREADRSKKGKTLFLTKGIHLVVDQTRFPLQQAVYFDTESDGRMVFAIPRDGKVYIGTTDTAYEGEIASPRVTEEDCQYVLAAANYMFPTINLTGRDVESSWAGLRPLIYEEGKKASEISRKDEVFFSPSGLISIAGGKLTGYRKMAEKVVDIVCKELHVAAKCKTEKLVLSGGKFGGAEKFSFFLTEQVQRGIALGLEEQQARNLVQLYGSNVQRVYEIMETNGDDAFRYGMTKALHACLVYGIEEEMVTTPIDYFVRRTGAIYFNISWVKKVKGVVLELMAGRLQWSMEEKREHHSMLKKEIAYAELTEEKISNL